MDVRDDGLEHVDIAVVAFRRKIAALPRSGVEDVGAIRHGKRGEPRQGALAQSLLPLVFGQIEPVRRQRLVDRAAARMLHRLATRFVVIGDLLEALACGVLALRLDGDRRVAEIIEQRVHPLLEQRQPMLHAGMAAAFGDGFIELVVGAGRAELGDIAHAEATDGLGDELKLRDRHQVERAHVEQRALGLGVEGADRLQRVAKEVEADRLVETGREEIEDAAAHGIFAGLAHGRGAGVAVMLQPGDDRVHWHDMAGRNRQRLRGNRIARGHALHDGIDRGQHDQRLVAAGKPREPRQRGQALRQNAAMRRDAVIGLAVPGRKLQHRQVGREKFQRARQLLHPRPVTADHGKADCGLLRPRRDRAREIGDDEALGTFGDIGERQRAAGREQRCGRFDLRFHAP